MPRGGFRLGAGRPKGASDKRPRIKRKGRPPKPTAEADPLAVIRTVMQTTRDEKIRLKAAEILAPYEHVRAADKKGGKKEQQAERAKIAARGRFGPRPPPKLVVDNAG